MRTISLRQHHPLTAVMLDLHPLPLLDTVRAKDAAVEAAEEVLDVIHCRAAEGAGVELQASEPWQPGKSAVFMYMPAGTHTITAGFRGAAVRLTVAVDESTAQTVQASFDKWKSLYPKQKPFGCFEHEEKAASVWPERFEWKQDGVYCAAEPSDLGAAEVNGRRRRSWSPSFTTDADYTQATEATAANGMKVLHFPPGVRGSPENPARITGIAFCCGTLTNKPAFKAISPVKAKEQEGQADVITATWSEAARAAALEARKRNGLHGQEVNPGEAVRFHTPMEKGEEDQIMHVVEDRGERVLVQHNQGFEKWRVKPQSVHKKADLMRHTEAAKATDPTADADTLRAAGTSECARLGWEHRQGMHPTQMAYAAAKAHHDVVSELVRKDKAAAPIQLTRDMSEADLEKQVAQDMAIEDKHGYWESHDLLRRAEDGMINAVREHMQTTPEFQAKPAEQQKLALEAMDRGRRHVIHRAKIVDLSFRYHPAKGSVLTASDGSKSQDVVRAAVGAYAPGHDFHGNQYTREATYQANISSDRAQETGYASDHLEASAAHQKAMDLHMEHGDKADAAGHDSTAAKHYKQALKHGVKAAFHKGRGEALDKFGRTLSKEQFENRHARGELLEHKTYEAYKQHHEGLLASGEREATKATAATPDTPEAILASLAVGAEPPAAKNMDERKGEAHVEPDGDEGEERLCKTCGHELAKNGTCSVCAPAETGKATAAGVAKASDPTGVDAILASLSQSGALTVLASLPTPAAQAQDTPEAILASLAHTKGK